MNHRVAALTLFGLLLLAFTSGAVVTRAQGHSIRGKVRSSSGYNLPRITVDLQTGNGALIQQTVTNNEGDFFFSGLGENSYVVAASAPDFNPTLERVEFFRATSPDSPGETRTIEITLNAKGGGRPPRAGLNFVQNVPKAARDSFDLGAKLARDGKSTEAVAALQAALKIFPDYFDARFVLANEFIKASNFNDAIVQLNEATRINPKDDRVFYSFGMILMQQQKYAVAARIFAEAARLSPGDPQYPLKRGTSLIDQVAMIDPAKDKTAASDLSYIYSEAEKDLVRAFALSERKLADVQIQLARLYEKKGDRARVASALEQYLKLSPNVKNAPAIREAITKLRAPAAP